MKNLGSKIKNILKIGLLTFFVSAFFMGGVSYGANDLLRQLFDPAVQTNNIIDMGENVNTVGQNVFEGTTEISFDGVKKTPSIVVKITRLLLTLVIALSITMILYNGLTYIIQTGQGKEGKSLVKNIVYIVIGIIISLLSVVIITIIQSIPETIDQELSQESNNKTDNAVIENGKGKSLQEVGKDAKDRLEQTGDKIKSLLNG